MGTNKQWKRVPFDIELAKKIQSGEVEGRVVNVTTEEISYTKYGSTLVDTHKDTFIELPEETSKHELKVGDKIKVNFPQERLEKYEINREYQKSVLTITKVYDDCVFAKSEKLKEECFNFDEIVPYEEKREFKPFDKVLVRNHSDENWKPSMFWCETIRYKEDAYKTMDGDIYKHLLGTTKNIE